MDSTNYREHYEKSQQPQKKTGNGLGVASLVLGIIGFFTAFLVIGILFDLIAITLGIIAIVSKKQKSGLGIAGLIIAVASIILLAFVGSLFSDEGKTISSQSIAETPAPQESESEMPEETISKKESTANNQSVFNIGDVAEYKGVQVSVLNYSESEGDEWSTPDDGKVFVYPEIEIINNSDKEISVSSIASFDAYCDGYKLDYSSNALMASASDSNLSQLDGSVASGKKLNGHLGLEVPDDWKTIEIYYKDNVWLDSNFSFVIDR